MSHISLNHKQTVLQRVRHYAKVMDGYGLDAIVGLLPGAGDLTLGLISTLYLVYEAHQMGLSDREIRRIIYYQCLDLLIGLVPVVGDIADFFYTANRKALHVFEDHVKHHHHGVVIDGEVI